MTAIRALAESFNMATVRLGLDVGLEPIGKLLTRLGLDTTPALYPSLLLGALELSPLEVTQIYNSLANGGFRLPLRAVRAVVASDGSAVQRYPLEIEQAADPAAVFGLNQALMQVMARGTGRTAQATVGNGLVTAGKTGTSDGFRDSWFAGFTNDQLVVTWIGNDENLPTGLTEARALRASGRPLQANLKRQAILPQRPRATSGRGSTTAPDWKPKPVVQTRSNSQRPGMTCHRKPSPVAATKSVSARAFAAGSETRSINAPWHCHRFR